MSNSMFTFAGSSECAFPDESMNVEPTLIDRRTSPRAANGKPRSTHNGVTIRYAYGPPRMYLIRIPALMLRMDVTYPLAFKLPGE